jgi:hypothetical protein
LAERLWVCARGRLQGFEPANIAFNAAISACKIRVPVVAKRVLKMEEFEPEALSNVAWALATNRVVDEIFPHAVANDAILKFEGLILHAFMNKALAFSTLGVHEDSLVLLCSGASCCVNGCLLVVFSRVLWAFSFASIVQQGFVRGASTVLHLLQVKDSVPKRALCVCLRRLQCSLRHGLVLERHWSLETLWQDGRAEAFWMGVDGDNFQEDLTVDDSIERGSI